MNYSVKMGKTQSKEEIIIAQAGNSGGVSAFNGENLHRDVLLVILCLVVLVAGIYYVRRKCKKYVEGKIRAEIARSRLSMV